MFTHLCTSSWAIPLSITLRKSFDSGELPKACQEANITPFYNKTESCIDSVSYRHDKDESLPIIKTELEKVL